VVGVSSFCSVDRLHILLHIGQSMVEPLAISIRVEFSLLFHPTLSAPPLCDHATLG